MIFKIAFVIIILWHLIPVIGNILLDILGWLAGEADNYLIEANRRVKHVNDKKLQEDLVKYWASKGKNIDGEDL
jgi:hypothetical protein